MFSFNIQFITMVQTTTSKAVQPADPRSPGPVHGSHRTLVLVCWRGHPILP